MNDHFRHDPETNVVPLFGGGETPVREDFEHVSLPVQRTIERVQELMELRQKSQPIIDALDIISEKFRLSIKADMMIESGELSYIYTQRNDHPEKLPWLRIDITPDLFILSGDSNFAVHSEQLLLDSVGNYLLKVLPQHEHERVEPLIDRLKNKLISAQTVLPLPPAPL